MEFKVTNSSGEVYAANYLKLDDIKCAPRVWSLEIGIKLAGKLICKVTPSIFFFFPEGKITFTVCIIPQ